jgi:phenylacetic acid degradation operon negative regulatory protein
VTIADVRHGDAATGGRGDGATRRRGDTASVRRAEASTPVVPKQAGIARSPRYLASPSRRVAMSPCLQIPALPPRPQAMLFTLWGDYITHRGGEIWVGSLIRIGTEFGLSADALRSVLSRMVRSGWLRSTRHGNRGYYRLTGRGEAVIGEGARRIFRPRREPWDGLWHLVSYSVPEPRRHLRDRFRKRLSYLGFGSLSTGSWISPHDLRAEVEKLAAELNVNGFVEQFRGAHIASSNGRALAARVWPLKRLAAAYRSFDQRWRTKWTAASGVAVSEPRAFVLRFWLTHEYQRFLLDDPDLPSELLPPDWPGRRAAALFERIHDQLATPANRFFDAVYEPYPGPTRHQRPTRPRASA